MNVLFLCHRFPFPPNRGGKIRPFNMIRHLAERCSVTVASLAHTEEELREGAGLKKHCSEVIAEVVPSTTRWKQAMLALPTPKPSSVAYFWSEQLRRRIEARCKGTPPDLIWVHCAFAAPYVHGLKAGFRVMDYGDLDSGKWLDYAVHRSWPLSAGFGFEARKVREFERETALQFDYCTFTTYGELQAFRALEVQRPCSVIPNGVDLAYFTRARPLPRDSQVMIFLGRMDYFPNIDGVVDFALNTLPRIQKVVPGAELRIVGSNPVRQVRRLGRLPGVTVTGKVPDVRPYLEDAALAIAPLRIARGTQNKILECMAMGVPVVATSQAGRGIQAIPGKHLLVADGRDDFVQKAVELLRNPELRAEVSESGRHQVEAAHSWALSIKLLDRLIESAPVPQGLFAKVSGPERISTPSASAPCPRSSA
jgi:sugar transferase (PEP-CTERM/EpsH1 system associated)